MTLRQKQAIFTVKVAQLILKAKEWGYDTTFGEAYRPPELVAIYAERGTGSPVSLHPERLAIDLNLFRGAKYLATSEAHRPLGEWWEQQSEPARGIVCCWGGRFRKPDGNHYSLEHQGRR